MSYGYNNSALNKMLFDVSEKERIEKIRLSISAGEYTLEEAIDRGYLTQSVADHYFRDGHNDDEQLVPEGKFEKEVKPEPTKKGFFEGLFSFKLGDNYDPELLRLKAIADSKKLQNRYRR